MKKILNGIISNGIMSACIALFAIAIAIATFIENDYGTPAAQALVYRAHWFEFLLLILSINLIGNSIKMKLFRKEKLAILLFHLSFFIIILGSAITRYISFEGMMHIRENDTSNIITSGETYMSILASDQSEDVEMHEKVFFTNLTKASFQKDVTIGETEIKVELTHFIPDAQVRLSESSEGKPIISAIIGGAQGRQSIYLETGTRNIGGVIFSFNDDFDGSHASIEYDGKKLNCIAKQNVTRMRMQNQVLDTLAANEAFLLELQTLYNFNGLNIVFNDFKENVILQYVSAGIKSTDELQDAVVLQVSSENSLTQEFMIWGSKGRVGEPKTVSIDGINISIAYGSKKIELPFSLLLDDFQLDRYPGSNSPSSYASEITLIDEGNSTDHRIFMNNVLNHKGYRFFQSSYDKDEQGTYLSVNHDYWGTLLTYFGYSLLSLGMLFTLFTKKSRFLHLSRRLSRIREKKIGKATVISLIILFGLPLSGIGQTVPDSLMINNDHARNFGKIQVQDQQGRMKPINTLSSQLVRKVSGKSTLYGLQPDQILLGMMTNSMAWQDIPMIKVNHPDLNLLLGLEGKLAAFSDIFDGKVYKLSALIEEANNTSPSQRSLLLKEVIKVDERFNICYLIYIDEILRVFPLPDDPDNKWYTATTGERENFGEANIFVKGFFGLYLPALGNAQASGDWAKAEETLGYLRDFQSKFGKEILLSEKKVNMEILYNDLQIFKQLSKYYGLLGILMLIVLLIHLFNPKRNFRMIIVPGTVILLLLTLAHTAGLVFRWYISGHAPWSNGYESMIFIGWATMLAGFIFSRKSMITLAITAVLTSLILWVASLNWLDPEITNLVPVLDSYWLMIHVSLITASYGFLALGFLLAFFNLVIMIFMTKKNVSKIKNILTELTIIIEMALTIGLFLLAIGTFLGGVWANESWGRYWGWDAKETWALVTVLVYSFILHLRFIPVLASQYIFNLLSMFGFASVIMTYFGVNYYLSGLHSYATGDPVPIPSFVYYTLLILILVSIMAVYKEGKWNAIKEQS